MTLDTSRQQRFGPPLNFNYAAHAQAPVFSNPWSSNSSPSHSSAAASHPLYAVSHHHQHSIGSHAGMVTIKDRVGSGSASAMAAYGPMAPSAGRFDTFVFVLGTKQTDNLPGMHQDIMGMSRLQTTSASYGDPSYATTAPRVSSHGGHFAASSAAPYEAMGYAPAPVRSTAFSISSEADPVRRFTHQQSVTLPLCHAPHRPTDVDPRGILPQPDDRRSFADALDASQGMLAMSQDTPRNIYGSRDNDRSSVDSYPFPSTHSTSSSISSSNLSSYYGDSVSEYSTAGSDMESANSRTLPRPPSLMSSQIPPVPQSMMGQFSAKMLSSAQKKHKCKVCDKRFTRPSSLQTHMYSHTGEKRTSTVPYPFRPLLTVCFKHLHAKWRGVVDTSPSCRTCGGTARYTAARLRPKPAPRTTTRTRPGRMGHDDGHHAFLSAPPCMLDSRVIWSRSQQASVGGCRQRRQRRI
ncbi:C2H2 finger domain protein FlbC [Drechmeria coniospora]|uniref:C2H2 finger domain protein FlbC n=1 Tax=Drechmeria coniospora TaxID=98403 RepID=A0A151GIJ7_DRECN|nr:C2H2 finger domain protein FlbC [Drechmeria coniospora]KYK56852.1 C2H2 finger domain protein FlbC [Drechmeria coniospora]